MQNVNQFVMALRNLSVAVLMSVVAYVLFVGAEQALVESRHRTSLLEAQEALVWEDVLAKKKVNEIVSEPAPRVDQKLGLADFLKRPGDPALILCVVGEETYVTHMCDESLAHLTLDDTLRYVAEQPRVLTVGVMPFNTSVAADRIQEVEARFGQVLNTVRLGSY